MGWTEVGDLLMEDSQYLDKKGVTHGWGSGKDPDNLELRVGVAVVNDRVIIIVGINDGVIWKIWEARVEELNLAFSMVIGRVTLTFTGD